MSARSFNIHTTRKQGQINVTHDSRGLKVHMYDTTIVVLDALANTVRLNSGGWLTASTKTAINNALRQIHAPFYVTQIKGQWFIQDQHGKQPFYDGMVIERGSGAVINTFDMAA